MMMKLLRSESRSKAIRAINPIAILAVIGWLTMTPLPSHANETMALTGNRAPGAADLAAHGITASSDQSLQMEIYLKPHNQAAFDQLLEAQQDPASPQYHKWLTPTEYSQQFGPTAADVSQISQWLSSEGFTVTYASAQQSRIKFEGNVGDAETAFNVKIAASADGKKYGNVEDPLVPASLAPKISYLAGLDNLHGNLWQAIVPVPPSILDGKTPYFGPNDIRTFNDETPLLNAGDDGTGQCIGVSEGSDVDQASLGEFNTLFDLPAFTSSNFVAVYPDGQPSAPGIDDGGAPYGEAILDVEYAHGIAPGATIVLYAADAGNDAPDPVTALVDTVKAAVDDTTNNCATLAVSWAQCGEPSSFFTNLDGIFAQGASEGKSIFVATGDVGTSAPVPSTCGATRKPDIEENAGSPHVTAVGASMFKPSYDSDGNDTSTLSNTTQSVWNIDLNIENFFVLEAASTGGYSGIFPLPSWQKGVPGIAGKFRAVPDLVLGGGTLGGKLTETFNRKTDKTKVTGSDFAAPYFWICLDSGYLEGEGIEGGYECTIGGGTSIVPPQYAGLFAIVTQKTGKQQGLINPTLYSMAKANLKNPSAVGIVDITTGNNAIAPVTGYSARKGYDLASGWGAIDMDKFVTSFIAAGD
jgi:subtilase family serine protease